MERNRRIAKAYARKHVITVDGSRNDYLDGATLGLNSFDNPDRDSKTTYLKQNIGEGVKLKIQQNGDIFVKRLSKASVFVHQFKFDTSGNGVPLRNQLKSSQSSSDVYALNSEAGGEFYGVVGPRRQQINVSGPIGRFTKLADPSKSSSGASSRSPTSSSCASSASSTNLAASGNHMDLSNALQPNRLVRIFNMAKFKELLEYESRQTTPNRVRLHSMCISIINFIYDDQKMLNLPSWIMVINIVAIDLLSSKIGLVGPYDMSALDSSGPPVSGYRLQASQFNKLARNKSFEQFSSANDYDRCDFEVDEDESYRKFNGYSTNRNRQRLKKSGATDNESQFIMLRNRQPPLAAPHLERHQNMPSGGDSSNSIQYYEGRPALLQATRSEGELKALGVSYNSGEVGSSSSGFDSNCSYQNATPATSSSSIEFAHNELDGTKQSGVPADKPVSQSGKKVSKLRRFFKSVEPSKVSEPMLNREESSSSNASSKGLITASSANIRGKRPPKLPHGISGHASEASGQSRDEPVTMSEPIPIPAPPTSAGGPSGKANLILVSPTGLSPPSRPKRANPANYLSQQSDDLLPREFETIKHIDEEGRCATILDQSARSAGNVTKMPTGIPPHAQLAPPATQRHILRYLMSTARNMSNYPQPPRASDENPSNRQPSNPGPPVPPSRPPRRPLPVLPPGHRSGRQHAQVLMQSMKPRASDESLYYSGLQARVPKFQHQQSAMPLHPITKSAIDAILSDFKQNAYFRQHQQQQKLNQIRHEQLLLAKMRSNSAGQVRLVSNMVNGHPDYSSDKASSGGLKKPSKVSALGLHQDYMRSLESLNRLGSSGTNHGRPLANLLNHMGGFLRRSRAKKSEVVEVN